MVAWSTTLTFGLAVALSLPRGTTARPPAQVVLDPSAAVPSAKPSPRPLVIWQVSNPNSHSPTSISTLHGLGDTAHSEGINGFIEDVKTIYPGIFVYSVQIPLDGSEDDERKAGFWGYAEGQGESGCDQLSSVPELVDGFDAIGFSQGGLFLRYYAQYCAGPPVRNLITFGTPHYGIAVLIPCPTPPTLTCLLAARAARSGIYTPWAQSHLVQAAYFRDTDRLDEFFNTNTFIRDLNGETPDDDEGQEKKKRKTFDPVRGLNVTGREGGGNGLSGVDNLIAIAFDEDRTVSPALSAHWSSYLPGNKSEATMVHLNQSALYKDDWIGLRKLDESGRLWLENCPGRHMELGGEGGCADRMVRRWVGGA